jgi:hypothetical protein
MRVEGGGCVRRVGREGGATCTRRGGGGAATHISTEWRVDGLDGTARLGSVLAASSRPHPVSSPRACAVEAIV